MSFQAKWQTTALNDTCTIETGSAATSPVSQITSVACMEVPPTEYEDDTTLKLLVVDTNESYDVGCRVVYDSLRYLIERVQRDGTYTILMSKSWPESLT